MKRFALLFALLPTFLTANSQEDIWDKMCVEDYRPDSSATTQLGVTLESLAFFKDNEFDSNVLKGYSLPGAWFRPRFTCQPIDAIRLELGMHAAVFDGANKYPNYAYHDIGTWKGNQYQRGAHVLPFLRMRASLKHLTCVLGNIYGVQNHQLVTPMFNAEQNISADPEMGVQILLDRKHVHYDLWLNWQSYIFEEDTHQEAFTVGSSAKPFWQLGSHVQLSTPVQLLIQHRGGEQDITSLGVQTLCNAFVGVAVDYTPRTTTLSHFKAQAGWMGSYQQSGQLWPFDVGHAVHAATHLTFFRQLHLELGYVGAPRQFANLYGSPFFGTLSQKQPGLTFKGMHTVYSRLDYTYTFADAYSLGAEAEVFSPHTPGHHPFCFTFGISMHVAPDILLKRKGRKT